MMSVNKEQHESFHKGLEDMEAYVDASLKDKQLFDGDKLVEMIDGFGPPLREHLAAEIGTLLELEKYGDKLSAVNEMIDRDGKENMVSYSLRYCFLAIPPSLPPTLFPKTRWLT